jgi:acetate kinase
MRHFGIAFDADKNKSLVGGAEGRFESDDSSIELWVIPTDEECQIAKETRQTLGLD